MHQKQSKLWDMRFYWLRDKDTQKQIKVHWEKGATNLANHFTKHRPMKYHVKIRRDCNFVGDHSEGAS